MQIKANGIRFHCQIEGPEGGPWLIFSNSLATNLSMWDDQAASFRRSYRVLRYISAATGERRRPKAAMASIL